MNNVSIIGRLTKDAELLDFNDSERKAIKFTVAVDRIYKNSNGEKDTDFIPVIYFTSHWNKLLNFLTKGKLVSIAGKLTYRTYVDSNDQKKSSINVVADNIEFLEKKKEEAI